MHGYIHTYIHTLHTCIQINCFFANLCGIKYKKDNGKKKGALHPEKNSKN